MAYNIYLPMAAALRKVMLASPYVSYQKKCSEDEKRMPTWKHGHAALLWSIYERAAMDYYSHTTSGNEQTRIELAYLERTALGGLITTPQGRDVNILETLGIDPLWAHEIIEHTYQRGTTMINQGWAA